MKKILYFIILAGFVLIGMLLFETSPASAAEVIPPQPPAFNDYCTGGPPTGIFCGADAWECTPDGCDPNLEYDCTCQIVGCQAESEVLCSNVGNQSTCLNPCANYECQAGGGSCTWVVESEGGESCSCTWDDRACGGGTCADNKRKQVLECEPAGCDSGSRCVADSSCESPSCNVTAPTDPISNPTPTSVSLTWTPGTGGDVQKIRIGTNETQVEIGCPGGVGPDKGCQVAQDLPAGQSSFQTGDILTPSTLYYWRVAEFDNDLSNCWIDFGGVINSSFSETFTTSGIDPWWQAIDSDITTNASITSDIPSFCSSPCSPYLILDGAGGYPGIPLFAGTLTLSAGEVSSRLWRANTTYSDERVYNYAWFSRLIPSDTNINEITTPLIQGSDLTTGGVETNGYYWYHFAGESLGDLEIESNTNIPGDRKIILLVEGGDLYINGNIQITQRGQGFFMAIVGETDTGAKGNIFINSSVSGPPNGTPELEGLFVADKTIRTGSLGEDADNQLHVRGSLAAYQGIVLERDLADDTQTPAELFELAPEFFFLFPKELHLEKMRWEEVAP